MEFVIFNISIFMLIVWVMEWSGDYLVLVFFLATSIVKLFLCFAYPLLIEPMTSSTETLPAYADNLMKFIAKVSAKAGFNPEVVLLEKSMSTNVHVNASCSLGKIKLGEQLFKGHGEWPAEIVAVLCHELGHFKLSHLIKQSLVDTLYMVVFGTFLQLMINQPSFLVSFGFPQESYFATLILFTYFYSVSLDVPIRIGLNAYGRYQEW